MRERDDRTAKVGALLAAGLAVVLGVGVSMALSGTGPFARSNRAPTVANAPSAGQVLESKATPVATVKPRGDVAAAHATHKARRRARTPASHAAPAATSTPSATATPSPTVTAAPRSPAAARPAPRRKRAPSGGGRLTPIEAPVRTPSPAPTAAPTPAPTAVPTPDPTAPPDNGGGNGDGGHKKPPPPPPGD